MSTGELFTTLAILFAALAICGVGAELAKIRGILEKMEKRQ